jgi:hypothetical protein
MAAKELICEIDHRDHTSATGLRPRRDIRMLSRMVPTAVASTCVGDGASRSRAGSMAADIGIHVINLYQIRMKATHGSPKGPANCNLVFACAMVVRTVFHLFAAYVVIPSWVSAMW